MRIMSPSDCSALPRLLTLLYDASQLTNVAEPLPGFKPAITASSFLLDVIKRNRNAFNTRQRCERVVAALSEHTKQSVSLQTREYITRHGRTAKLFGIQVGAMTLWSVYGVPEPRDTVDLSTPFTPEPPETVAQLATLVDLKEPDPVTYFDAIRCLPDKQREWLLMQHKAMYRALNRDDVYALFCQELDH